jgi:hypothetical protein
MGFVSRLRRDGFPPCTTLGTGPAYAGMTTFYDSIKVETKNFYLAILIFEFPCRPLIDWIFSAQAVSESISPGVV